MLLLREKGHTVKFYKVMRFYVPKSILKWVPKVSTNIIGSKFIRGSNIAS